MHRPENKTDLERALREHLGPEPAPDQLWDRVEAVRHGARPSRASTPPAWTAWATAAAALAITAGGWTAWKLLSEPVTVEAIAVESLAKDPQHLGLRSGDAVEVRNWLRDNAGLDIPLPPRHSPLIQIVGAGVLQADAPVAEIAYRVGDSNATLLVTKAPTGARTYPSHEVRPSESFQSARVSSWSMRGQSYTLAWAAPGEFRVACLLCHGNEPPLLN